MSYRLYTSFVMNLRMLLRRKIVLLLLTVIPFLFIILVHFTSSDRTVLIQLGINASAAPVPASEFEVALIFVTVATIGFLSSFLSLNLTQQYYAPNRRLVTCGYHPSELVLSSLTLMLIMIAILVGCVGAALLLFFDPRHFEYVILGMVLTGLTYGSYGTMVGTLVARELEGTLLVVLLANIDAGWLQNPLFFSGAQNKFIIQLLPAYHSSQVAIAAAFTDLPLDRSVGMSVLYAAVFLAGSITISYYKMRPKW
jgi:hypothetical protein